MGRTRIVLKNDKNWISKVINLLPEDTKIVNCEFKQQLNMPILTIESSLFPDSFYKELEPISGHVKDLGNGKIQLTLQFENNSEYTKDEG